MSQVTVHVPRWVRSLLFATALTLAGLLGRATVVDGGTLALIWPAGGVAALWLMWSTWRQRLLDLPLLAAAIFVLNLLTGASAGFSTLFIVINVGQAVAFVVILDRLCPRIDGTGGDESVSSTGQVTRFVAAAAGAAAIGVLIGQTGIFVLTGATPEVVGVVLWWGRQLAGVVVVALTGQLVWHAWRNGTLLRGRGPSTAVFSVEVALLLIGSAALYAVVFVQSSLPLAFLPAIVSVWAGLRLTPAWTALHGSVGSALVIVFTVQGTGPFALAPGDSERAGMAQLLVAVLMFIGLSLSVAVETSEQSLAEVAEEQERAAAEAARAADQARLLSTINETLEDALVVVGPQGDLVRRNAAAARLMGADGFTPTAPAGSPAGVQPWTELLRMAVDGELDEAVDVVVVDAELSQLVFRVVARPLRAAPDEVDASQEPTGGDTPGAVLVLTDVTADRAHREELANFAGVVAHDLRNPIGVVRGWADELRFQVENGETDADSLLRIGTSIGRAAERMESLIGDLLTHAVSRDQALDHERLDVSTVVQDVAAARGVCQHLVTTRMPAVVGDLSMVRQLLDNLIGNSLKYVAPGVTPHVEITGTLVDGRVEVSLLDNGIGVPAHATQLIFQQFQRAHRVGYQGTGLGLAICRTIVERHGGTIGVEPGPDGVGSRFWFSLPAADDLPAVVRPRDRPAEPLRSVDVV